MDILKTVLEEYKIWCDNTKDDEYMQRELTRLENSPEELLECFGGDLGFGTSGIRGLLGPGPRRINSYVIARATQGLADYILKQKNTGAGKVVIAYDTRLFSKEFAEETAKVLSGNNIDAYLFSEVTPVPVLSYSIGELDCDYGIMITASHNAGIFNGYKVYNRYGYQIVGREPKEILEHISDHGFFDGINRNNDKIHILDDVIKESFISKVKSITWPFVPKDEASNLNVVYTPLNGTGNNYMGRVLADAGFSEVNMVTGQQDPDPKFTTCKNPNPEKLSAYNEAFRVLDQVNGDIIIATDPDSDRVGVALIHDETKINLTGNQIALLMLDYLCSVNPPKPGDVCLRSIVTTPLIDRVAESYGLDVITTLIGFKYIGNEIQHLIDANNDGFYFGTEESNGFLIDSFVKDKDAISSAVIIASMAAKYKAKGQDLIDHLNEIYGDYGALIDRSRSFTFQGLSGQETMEQIMNHLRNDVNEQIGDLYIEDKTDYLKDDTGLPKADIIRFDMDDGSTAIIRPSGTEPKIKVYMFLTDPVSPIDKGITEIMDGYKE